MTFAESLARWIKIRGITPYRAAQLLGVEKQTVYNWLAGAKCPHQKAFLALMASIDD